VAHESPLWRDSPPPRCRFCKIPSITVRTRIHEKISYYFFRNRLRSLVL
jgi:hypothetical protein